jgi:hypothetical protein
VFIRLPGDDPIFLECIQAMDWQQHVDIFPDDLVVYMQVADAEFSLADIFRDAPVSRVPPGWFRALTRQVKWKFNPPVVETACGHQTDLAR